jgi:hypothetical protein
MLENPVVKIQKETTLVLCLNTRKEKIMRIKIKREMICHSLTPSRYLSTLPPWISAQSMRL